MFEDKKIPYPKREFLTDDTEDEKPNTGASKVSWGGYLKSPLFECGGRWGMVLTHSNQKPNTGASKGWVVVVVRGRSLNGGIKWRCYGAKTG